MDLVGEGIGMVLRVHALGDSSLSARKLMPCGFRLCALAAYINPHGRPKHPNELARYNCLIYSQGQYPETWFFQDA